MLWDILQAVDRDDLAAWSFWTCRHSAAFNTVDHSILWQRPYTVGLRYIDDTTHSGFSRLYPSGISTCTYVATSRRLYTCLFKNAFRASCLYRSNQREWLCTASCLTAYTFLVGDQDQCGATGCATKHYGNSGLVATDRTLSRLHSATAS